jgi:hypothetical protein
MSELFEDAGAKIRSYAIGVFIFGLVVSAISAFATFVFFVVEAGIIGFFLGAIIAVIEFLIAGIGSYISCLLLVAFGDLVQYTVANWKVNNQILQKLSVNVEAPSVTPPEPATPSAPKPSNEPPKIADNEVNASYWTCGNCNTKNLSSRSDCWACGQQKAFSSSATALDTNGNWFCSSCGTKNLKTSSYCEQCGTPK